MPALRPAPPTAPASPTEPPNGAGPPPLGVNRNFQLLWAGEAVSTLGSTTTTVLFPLIAITVFDAGPVWIGILAGAVWLPWLILGLGAGVVVDRSDPRSVMMAADLLSVAAVASVPLAWAMGRLSLVQLALVAFVLGASTVFFRTSYAALVPRVVRLDDLTTANARIYGTESAMQIAGPGLGGLLAQAFSAAGAVILDAATFIASWVALWRMDTSRLAACPPPPDKQPILREVADGIRIVAHDPYLRFFTLHGALANFALTGYGALMVLFLVRDLNLAPSSVGTVVALGAAGGLLGATVATKTVRRLGDARALRWLQVLGGPPAVLVGLAQPGLGVTLVPIGTFLVGVGIVGANAVRGGFRGRYVPAELMGRTTATSAVLNFGVMPVAALAAGTLGSAIGVRETILVMGALNAVAGLLVFIGPYRRGRDMPTGRLRLPGSGTSSASPS